MRFDIRLSVKREGTNGVSGTSGGGSLSLVRRSPKKTVKGDTALVMADRQHVFVCTSPAGVHFFDRVRGKQPLASEVRTSGHRLISNNRKHYLLNVYLRQAREDGLMEWCNPHFPFPGSDVTSCTHVGTKAKVEQAQKLGGADV